MSATATTQTPIKLDPAATYGQRALADALGVSESTLFAWRQLYDDRGMWFPRPFRLANAPHWNGRAMAQWVDSLVRGSGVPVTTAILAAHANAVERPGPKRPAPGVKTYFFQAAGGGPVKIGKTWNVRRRLAGIQVCNPAPLVCLGVIDGDHEGRLHRQFAGCHVSGEWFAPIPDLLTLIAGQARKARADE